jgi:hypothetical protein
MVGNFEDNFRVGRLNLGREDNIKTGIACNGDRLYGLVARVLGYRSGGTGSIPGTTRKEK